MVQLDKDFEGKNYYQKKAYLLQKKKNFIVEQKQVELVEQNINYQASALSKQQSEYLDNCRGEVYFKRIEIVKLVASKQDILAQVFEDDLGLKIPSNLSEESPLNKLFSSYIQINSGFRKEKSILLLYIKNESVQENKNFLLICSHGNSSDLVQNKKHYEEISGDLNVDILAYEYCGYGPELKSSKNKVQFLEDDQEIIDNVIQAYKFATKVLDYKWNQIFAYGHSLGTGPSTILASNRNTPVAGVILHSPFSSGLNLVDARINTVKFYDVFPNFYYIRQVRCPIFLIHGKEDKLITIQHSFTLETNIQNKFNNFIWHAEFAGHNDVYQLYTQEFKKQINNFILQTAKIIKQNPPENFLPEINQNKNRHFYYKIINQIQENSKNKNKESVTQNQSMAEIKL